MKIMFSQCGRLKFGVLIKLENVIQFLFVAVYLLLIQTQSLFKVIMTSPISRLSLSAMTMRIELVEI